MKSSFLQTGNNGLLRKVLVTSQFAVTITLLIVMAFIYRQVNFMLEKDLGFQPEQVLKISMNTHESHRLVEQLKTRFKQIPGVQEVTTASSFPGNFLPDWHLEIEGKSQGVAPYVLFADADYAKTLNIEMVEGRFMDANIGADSSSNYVVNEEFVRAYDIKNPIGHKIKFSFDESYGSIVGVIKDFHTKGLNRKIGPIVMNSMHWRNFVGIKLSSNNLSTTISDIEALWSEIEPLHPMRYTFLDEDFAVQYAEQERFGKAILYATLITLFIALLGLFGLTAFSVQRRAKEIGIRKVLGASLPNILGLLTKDIMLLVGIASLIALPVGYYLVNLWLADFAHRIPIVWWIFVGSSLSILLIGFLTVSLQSLKAILVNPMDSLRSE